MFVSLFLKICSSELINQMWIVSLYGYGMSAKPHLQLDRPLLSRYFQILKQLCDEAQVIFTEKLLSFNTTGPQRPFTLSRKSFEIQMNQLIDAYIALFTDELQKMIRFYIDMLYYNNLPNMFNTDWSLEYGNESNEYLLRSIPHSYNNNSCNCMVSRACQRPLLIGPPDLILPGLVVSCTPIDGLRMSTLECFFSSSCIASIINHLEYYTKIDGSPPTDFAIPKTPSLLVSPLNDSIASRFSKKDPIHIMIEKQFVEEWTSAASYEQYYAACAPTTCRYEIAQRQSILHVITSLLGLYGGLTIGLRLLIWRATQISWLIKMRFSSHRSQVYPSN
jgi:hypothetical protein